MNHIANKRIEHINQKKQAALQHTEDSGIPTVTDTPQPTPTKKRAKEIISQIDSDVAAPVAAAYNEGREPSIDNTARMPELEFEVVDEEEDEEEE